MARPAAQVEGRAGRMGWNLFGLWGSGRARDTDALENDGRMFLVRRYDMRKDGGGMEPSPATSTSAYDVSARWVPQARSV
jgi:hypothetical protein